jgi:hypothetical protein
MPTFYTDQFFNMDPAYPPGSGTFLSVSEYQLRDNNNDGDIDRFNNDFVNNSDVVRSWPGDTITIRIAGGARVTYTGVTFYLRNGQRVFTPTDGQVLQPGTFVRSTYVTVEGPLLVSQLGPTCFTPGTFILCPDGQRPVEELKAGDLVVTADKGPQPVLHAHLRTVTARHLAEKPRHGPVLIPADALGPGFPAADLTVSPQHRILLSSRIVERMFGAQEILVPAAQLIGWNGIERVATWTDVTYIHLLFEEHEVLLSNGLPTESLLWAITAQTELSREDFVAIEATVGRSLSGMEPARSLVSGKPLKQVLARHAKNGKDLFDPEYSKCVAIAA